MTTLWENPLPIIALGAIAITICGLAVVARRNLASVIALVVVVAVTGLLLLAERLVVTDVERVENALTEVVAAVHQNDAAGVLAFIDPAAPQMRTDAETLMDMIRVKKAGASSVQVKVSDNLAEAKFQGVLSGTTKKGGAPIGYFDVVEVSWIKKDDRWRIDGFTPYIEGKPIDAVGSARSRRAVRPR